MRSHQLCMEGFLESCDGLVLTIWSAPNYCYRFGNKASVLLIKENKYKYFVFEESSENKQFKQFILEE